MHIPVLLKEVLDIFNPRPGEIYIDATINGGGHAKAILERIGSGGKLMGIDWDCELIQNLKESLNFKNLKLICDNYANLGTIVRKYNLDKVDGILFDLGFSGYHLENAKKGFSFLKNEPLDMRYNRETNELTASKIINTWPKEAIADVLRKFGEERFAGRIASGIVRARQNKNISSSGELAEIIIRSVPRWYLKMKIHPATRTFQALRIAVNHELENLEHALPQAVSSLKPKGKIVVISFHSLEDKIVKKFFNEKAEEKILRIITKKPIRASAAEIYLNPRARSAKLRAAEKT